MIFFISNIKDSEAISFYSYLNFIFSLKSLLSALAIKKIFFGSCMVKFCKMLS